jgi:selenocysteine-specific translation elongation factor
MAQLVSSGWTMLPTSAKTGEGVEELFNALCQMMTCAEAERDQS